MALVQPKIRQARGRPDDRVAIRRIGDGAVIDLLDADVAEGGHARDRRLDMRLEALQVLLEELVFRLGVRPVHVAAGRAVLVGTEDEAAILLAHVPGGIGFAQHAHFGKALLLARDDRRMGLGHDVLVLDRDDRDVEPDHGAGLAGEVAGGRHNVLAGDRALVGLDDPAISLARDPGHARVPIDRGAELARALRHRLGQVGRLDIAVVGMLDGAQDPVRFAKRPDLLQLLGGEQPDVHTDRVGDALVGEILVEAVPRAGEPDVRDPPEADILAGLGLELAVELDGILM